MALPDPVRPADFDAGTFVLRVRQAAAAQSARIVVDLEDVRMAKTWRFTSLEAAFNQLRLSVKSLDDPSGRQAKPH